MKAERLRKISAVFLVFLLIFQFFTLGVFATEEEDEDAGILDMLSDIWEDIKTIPKKISTLGTYIKDMWESMKKFDEQLHNFFGALRNSPLAGSAYRDYTDPIIKSVNKMYNVVYPLGVVIMLVCWAYGIFKDGMTSMFDLTDKHSIVRSCLSLIVGLTLLSLTGKILSVLISLSMQYTELIANNVPQSTVGFQSANISYLLFMGIVNIIFQLNVIQIAVLQGISPFFFGFAASESTRKLTFNFLKSYGKCLLAPIVTIAYTIFSSWALEASGGWNIINVIVILIACASTQKRLLSELFA